MFQGRILRIATLVLFAGLVQQVLCYDEKFDKIDVDKIIGNDALFTYYIDCWLDKGPCDKEYAVETKELMPEVISTACGKCTPSQKKKIKKLIQGLTTKKRAHQLKDMLEKYDPNREYFAKFAKMILSSN